MHSAFTDLFQRIHDFLGNIENVDALAKAAADSSLGVIEFWSAVHGTDLAPVYDKLRHAKQTALNAHFPASLREKGLADMKAIAAETLAKLTAPPEAEQTAETQAE